MASSTSTSMLPAWLSSTRIAYIAGLATAVGIATIFSHREALLHVTRKGRLSMWQRLAGVWMRKETNVEAPKGMVVGEKDEVAEMGVDGEEALIKGDGEAEAAVAKESEQENEVKREEVVRPKKPFKFRERLWYEPPEDVDIHHGSMYHSYEVVYGHFDTVQKKFKEAGGKDLEWKTNWLDLWTEYLLLLDYKDWAEEEAENEDGYHSAKEVEFYQELYIDLNIEQWEVDRDSEKNKERFGHSDEDEEELVRVILEAEMEAEDKRVGYLE